LKTNTTIRAIIGSWLICLLALSITPKIVIHNLIANHRDAAACKADINGTQVNKAGFNCHFENFVAESPFVPALTFIKWRIPFSFFVQQEYVTHHFCSRQPLFFALRGPPCLA